MKKFLISTAAFVAISTIAFGAYFSPYNYTDTWIQANVIKKGNVYFDADRNVLVVGDGVTQGGAVLQSSTGDILTADRVLISSSTGKIETSAITDTTLAFLDATSSIQTQINTKLAKDGFTASRVAVTDSTGAITVSTVTDTSLAFLDATSSIQTQIDSKVAIVTDFTLVTSAGLLTLTKPITVVDSDTDIVVDLPAATGSKYIYTIKTVDVGSITVTPDGADVIDASATVVLAQWKFISIYDYAVGQWLKIAGE